MNSIKAGLRFLTAGLTAAMLFAAASASAHPPVPNPVNYHFIYSGAPFTNHAVADGIMTIDTTLLLNPGNDDSTSLSLGHVMIGVTMTVSGATNGNGTFPTADFSHSYFEIFSNALDLNMQWVGQPQGPSVWGVDGDLNFFNTNVAANAPNGEEPFLLAAAGGHGEQMLLVSVTPVPTSLYHQGDAVPGISNAFFTSFGVPTINDSNEVAFFAQWKVTGGQPGSGIFTNGMLMFKAGDKLPGPSGLLTVKTIGNPVIDNLGHVAFVTTLTGTGTSPDSNIGVASSAPDGILAVVAQTGTHATGAPTNAIWRGFTSVALPGNGGGVLISGQMSLENPGLQGSQRPGPIVNALWATDSAGDLTLVLQEGAVIGTETVKSFNVLNAVAGTPGQTHAFNGNGQLVAYVTFTSGGSAIVHVALP